MSIGGPYRLDFHQPSKSHAAFVEDRMEWLFPSTMPIAWAASSVSLANSAHATGRASRDAEVEELKQEIRSLKDSLESLARNRRPPRPHKRS